MKTADPEFLVVVEHDGECAARHGDDAPDHLDVDERAAAKPDEGRGLETSSKIAEAIANGVGFVRAGAQMKQFAVGDYGNNLVNRD